MVAGAWYFLHHHARWYRVAIPVVGIPLAGYVLYSSVYPVPTFPYNLVVYAAVGWLVLGIVLVALSPGLRQRLAASPLFRLTAVGDATPGPSV